MNLIHFSGPALPMDDRRWMACAQAEMDAAMLRRHLPLDSALRSVPHRMRQLFGADAAAPGIVEAAVIAVYLSRRTR